MIDLKSQVNKNYIIQFSIKSRKGKVLNRQIQHWQDVLFHATDITLNGPHQSGFFFIVQLEDSFFFSRMLW